MELLQRAQDCWNASYEFRTDRLRNKRFTFGDQWLDTITVDGCRMTEEQYIRREGNIPLKNNLIRRLVRNVVGVFRSRLETAMAEWDAADLQRARRNHMEELYSRTMEEFLISGMAVHRKWLGVRNGIHDVWTDIVSPDSFFYDSLARDPRGIDLSVCGQIHELRFPVFAAWFATSPETYRRFEAIYGKDSSVKVTEIWTREQLPRRLCHDIANGRVLKTDEQTWRSSPLLRAMPSKWILDDVWRFAFITADGEILREGDSPLPGGSHPFVMKAYPFLDGEIHSFVSDIIDQQRYTNRLITLYDWVMRASAKGVLLFPQDALADHCSIDTVADQWSRFNGVIVYNPQAGQPLPQQVTGNTASLGIGELLQIQLKMMEDVSGVNGALQGRMENQSMSGTLYSQQTENSLTSLRDLLDSFDSFISDSLSAERLLSMHNLF